MILTDKVEILAETPVLVTLSPSLNSHGLNWN